MKKLALFALCATLIGCANTQNTSPVFARADTTFETSGFGKKKQTAQQNALANANQKCNTHTPVVIKDETIHHGVIDEKMGRVLEGMISILGVSSPDLAKDDDYEYKINFKCQ